jgi:hypothetical protein
MKSVLGPFLAKKIYNERITTYKALIPLLKHQFGFTDEAWMKQQIKAVKDNPEVYRKMA